MPDAHKSKVNKKNLTLSEELEVKGEELVHVLGMKSLSAVVGKLIEDKHRACAKELSEWRKLRKSAESKQ
jgi:hypothetical protein